MPQILALTSSPTYPVSYQFELIRPSNFIYSVMNAYQPTCDLAFAYAAAHHRHPQIGFSSHVERKFITPSFL